MWRRPRTPAAFRNDTFSVQPLAGNVEEHDLFCRLVGQRSELQEELGNALVEVENARVEKANVDSLWRSKYGRVHLICEQQYDRMLLGQRLLEEHEKHPGLSRAELEASVHDARQASGQRLEALRRSVLQSTLRKLPPCCEPIMADDEDLAARHQEAGRVLRQIWRIIQPDILKNHPAAAKLSGDQLQYFADLQRRLMRPRAAELGFDPSQLGFERRSPAELHRILGEIRAVLQHPGEDMDLDDLIVGETIQEQIAWLRSDIALLERGIGDAQAELCRLLDDPEYAERRFQLAMPEQEGAIQDRLFAQAETYKKEADKLEKELALKLGEDLAAA